MGRTVEARSHGAGMVRRFRHSQLPTGPGCVAHVFVDAPKSTVAQVTEKYGKPSEKSETSLTYGTLRLIIAEGWVVGVIFPHR